MMRNEDDNADDEGDDDDDHNNVGVFYFYFVNCHHTGSVARHSVRCGVLTHMLLGCKLPL